MAERFGKFELLGISRRTMLNKLDALAIPRPRKGK